MKETEKFICPICGKHKSPVEGQFAELIRPSLLEFIGKHAPSWDGKGFICLDDLGQFRKDYVKEVLQDEIGELSALDNEVIESLQQHEILSSDIEKQFTHLRPIGTHAFGWIAPDLNVDGAVGDASAGTAEKGRLTAEFQANGFIALLRDVAEFSLDDWLSPATCEP